MILRDDLKPGVQYRIPNCAHWTKEQIQQMIVDKAAEYNVSVGFRQDFLANNTFEGLLKLLTTECTVIYNSDTKVRKPSPDFIMLIQREGTYLFIVFNEHAYSCGGSNWRTIMGDVFFELFGK